MNHRQLHSSQEGEGGMFPPPSLRTGSPFFATLQVLVALVLEAGWVGGLIQLYEIFVVMVTKR